MNSINRSSVSKTGDLGGHTLLQDSLPLKIMNRDPVITEDSHGNPVHIMRLGGRFQFSEEPNANGRIYPTDVLEHAVSEIQEDIKARRVLGEFDHPPDAKIHLDRISHLITKLWMENNGEVFGEIEILDKTPCGSQLKALVESDICIGISSRGVGDMEPVIIENNEYYKVLPGYTFVTFDVVAEPSVSGSYLSVSESRNRFSNNNVVDVRRKREREILKEVKNLISRGVK